ncbi:type III pantothenate kinase [Flavobacterium cucumis]|uniref:Type III pantothenate kinase n=1 Tax=Flavobacterium cucumis TaxID=416016 RepID=A0A1M7ZV46_9FLAO|nr:type III pantothenate kinase [Flavobacterium cucumis]SHO72755.1 type III pantothenate kinase [Flavobacterium cucumis]
MLITIDVGNSRIKVAVFEQNTLIELFVFETNDAEKKFKKILKKYPNATHSTISSVGKINFEVFDYLKTNTNLQIVSHETKFPFTNLYNTPKTLGIDRMVVAAGAVLQYPSQNRLIIDAGTCITYDFVDKKDQYLGGAISPGVKIRYNSLHEYTAKLPLLEKKNIENFIGDSTENAIHSGIINGICYEIDGFISQYLLKNQDLTIILTGGDADFLAKRLKSTIFANSNFLLESLNLLSIYLHEND